MNKQLYEQPGCKILVVRFEASILQNSPGGYNTNGTQNGRAVSAGWDGGWDDSE